jgi:hypothetical protein
MNHKERKESPMKKKYQIHVDLCVEVEANSPNEAELLAASKEITFDGQKVDAGDFECLSDDDDDDDDDGLQEHY